MVQPECVWSLVNWIDVTGLCRALTGICCAVTGLSCEVTGLGCVVTYLIGREITGLWSV